MFKIDTMQGHDRMSTQDLLLKIEAAVRAGETDFDIKASGQHDIGGPLWHPQGKKLKFHVTNAGQRVGSMALPGTEILVEESASADVGWLNAGGIITVRGDAGERDREAEEVGGIRITRREAGDQVLDVLAEDVARREAAHQALEDHPVGVAVIGRQVEFSVRGVRVADVFLELVLEVLDAVEEREGKRELFLVFPPTVRDVFPVDPVAHRPAPVHVPHQGIQEIRRVSHRIDAADEAADTRSYDHVHRKLVLLQVLERSHRRSALGTAAAEDEGEGGPALADLRHPGLHFADCLFVGRVQAEAGGRSGLRRQDRG